MVFAEIINTFQDKNPFLDAVNKLAHEMGIPPDYLLIVMQRESNLDPAQWRSDGNAVGLIQFRESTANDLDTSLNNLSQMPASEQMTYVAAFFRRYKSKWHLLKTVTDVYLLVFYPAAVGENCNYVIAKKGTNAYQDNAPIDLNNDGVITVADFSLWFYNAYRSYESDTIKFKKCPLGDSSNIINQTTQNANPEYASNQKTASGEGVDWESILINDKDLTDLNDVINSLNIKMTPQELLNYEDNSKVIYNSYTANDKAPTKNGGNGYKTAVVNHLVVPVMLKIPIGKRDKGFMFKKTNFQEQTNEGFYLDKYALDLLKNPDFRQISESDIYGLSRVIKQQGNVSVYMWCKALGADRSGQWIDVTLFLDEVTLNNGKQGASFSIKLASINCAYNDTDGWHIPADTIKEFLALDRSKTFVNRSSTHSQNVTRDLNGDVKNLEPTERELTYFHNIIQSNDIVLIKFKNIKAEKPLRNALNVLNLTLDDRAIPGQIYDCIGLVDNNSVSSAASNTGVAVNITGRDLTKLIIEDGSYFFPISFCTDKKLNYFENASDDNQGVQRIQGTGNAVPNDLFNAYLNNSIGDIIQFVLSQEAKIQVCPDWVFGAYPAGEKTTFIYKNESNQNTITKAPGIWQICKISIDEKIKNRLIADQTIGSQQGSLINHINAVCQEPFVEFFTDTWGDKFYFIARIPPWDQQGYLDGANIATSNIAFQVQDSDIYEENLAFNDTEVATWFRLTPRANYFGNTENMALTYLKAVLLKEYAEIWGTRAMDIVTNYITYDSANKNSDQSTYDLDYLKKQSQSDLDFLIEVNAYLPFTRSGTVTMKSNRAIKKGCFIWLVATDEIAYVEYVSHSWSLNMTSVNTSTTLYLTRIMKRKYLKYYFNIVNLNKNKDEKITLQQLQSNEYSMPVQFIFKPDDKYLVTDVVDQNELQTLMHYFVPEDEEGNNILLQERLTNFSARNYRTIQSIVSIFSTKQNVTVTINMAPTEYDDLNNANLDVLLKNRAEVIKAKVVQEVLAGYGRQVADNISIGENSVRGTNGSANFITNLKIESWGTVSSAKGKDEKIYTVNREIFNFFLKRRQLA